MAPPARASVDCSYVGTGCNAGYSAEATFTCISPSLLRIVLTNTSTIDAADAANNVLSSLTFSGASPVASAADGVTIAGGSSVVNATYTDCGGAADGPDVTCEWSAGANYCPDSQNGCRGVDDTCLSGTDQCGLGFVGSRESTDVSCDSANNFQLDPLGDIDGSSDGPDWGTINSPPQTAPGSGVEAISDTVEVVVDVGTCVESQDLCAGVATFGSHYRHADATTTTTSTSTSTTTTSLPATTTTTTSVPTTTVTTTSTPATTSTSTTAPTTSTTSTTDTSTTTTGETSTTTTTLLESPLRHFQCSEIKPFGFTRISGVSIKDRFRTVVATLIKPTQVCAPADKRDEDPSAPLDPEHLAAYKVSASPAFNRVRGVETTNQLGTQRLDVKRPDFLMVPSAKSLVGPPSPLVDPLVGHFLCYKVGRSYDGPKFVKILGVPVEDQFGRFTLNLLKPKRLCFPADKNGESPGAENDPGHLLCYKARHVERLGPTPAFLADQFGTLQVTLTRRQELCVPTAVSVPPAGG